LPGETEALVFGGGETKVNKAAELRFFQKISEVQMRQRTQGSNKAVGASRGK